MRRDDPKELFDRARAGDRAALARLLSLVEHGDGPAREVSKIAHPLAGGAATVGITGAPGAGKSTLSNALVAEMRSSETTVAVLVVDPSSPLTGGAILGDRVRMTTHSVDPGVFIRSMATRGQLGGLTLAVPGALRVLDAVGMPWILVETVGVGQVEVDIARQVDTTIVVVNPGWGDTVQANKAGLMEIADIFVVNKVDRPGASETRRDLERMLTLSPRAGWVPPVISTIATLGEGVGEVWDAVQAHRSHVLGTGELDRDRERRVADELERLLFERLISRVRGACSGEVFDGLVRNVVRHEVDPWTAVDRLLDADDLEDFSDHNNAV